MTSTEQKILNIINRNRNKTARVQYISKYSGMSTSYVNLVCQGLCRRGHINFQRGLAVMLASTDVPTDVPADSLPQQPEPPAEEASTKEAPQSTEGEKAQENPTEATPILSLEGVNSELMKTLEGADCVTVENLAGMPIAKLMSVAGMNVKQAADLINEARRKIGMVA